MSPGENLGDEINYPCPLMYSEIFEIFEDFLKINHHLTHRKLAALLGWPVSYVADLKTGRRKLSSLRAMEFSEKANYSVQQIEHLLFLVIKDQVPERFAGFFAKRVSRKPGSTE